MKIILAVLILLVLQGCTSKKYSDDILEEAFEGYVADLVFHAGPWSYPKLLNGYYLRNEKLYFANLKENGEVESYKVNIKNCNLVKDKIRTIKEQVYMTVKQAYGEIPIEDSGVIVTDGNIYTLKFYSKKINSHISVEAGEVARLTTLWVDTAIQIKSLADKCSEVSLGKDEP